jgi:hypothetical protein
LLHPALAIPVDVLGPNGADTLTASHIREDYLRLHTDLPLTERQALRLRIHTAEDPPPLIILAIVSPSPDPTEPTDPTPHVWLALYHLTPYTHTRWHRWLTWLDARAQGAAWLPPADDADPDDAPHLRRLHRLLATGSAHTRRATPRYALAWQVRLAAADALIEAHTRNISEGGALIELPLDPATLDLAPNQRHDLILYHPDDGAHLQVLATITRIGDPTQPNAPHIALRFSPTSPDEAANLRAFIRSGIPPEERDDPLLLLDPADLGS